MITSTSNITIRRPKAVIYDFLMNPEQAGLWQTGVIALDAPDGFATGTKFMLTNHFLGQTVKIYGQIKSNDGHSHYEVLSTQGPIEFYTVWNLAETADGTAITLTSQISAGAVFRLAEPALQAIYKSRTDSDLATLKTLLEAGITTGEQIEPQSGN